MALDKLLKKVDTEKMYRHVLNLTGIGVRHVLDTPEQLKAAAEYIYGQFKSYGVDARMQGFNLEGLDETMYNVEGWVGDPDQSAAVIISHYDTVFNTPGANDNAAGVAVLLEISRVLSEEQTKNGKEAVPTVRFVAVAQEEGNPIFESSIRASAGRLGLKDDKQRYTTYQVAKIMKEHDALTMRLYQDGRAGLKRPEAMAQATNRMAERLPAAVLEHLRDIDEIYKDVVYIPGTTGLMGSAAWMTEAKKMGKKIKYTICLDEIGRTRKEENTQILPPGLTYDSMQTYKIDTARNIGDWALYTTNGPGEKLGNVFSANCEHESVDLHYGYFHIPYTYERLQQEFSIAMGSDHAVFWYEDIPALNLSDSAGWRPPYVGHTMGDTIDILDFEQIARICKAVLLTFIDPTL
ncbi:MAG: M28 family peptidase [Deltaproteobacteria bacterium]|nr:M28 family peptidase [Deltaproteobacteria bacterium]